MSTHLIIVVAFASALGATALANAEATNTFEILIKGGPHAGTYKAPASSVICLHVKQKQFSAAFKEFNARDPKALSEAGIEIANPDDAGAKRGEVRLAFGDPSKNPGVYDLFVPRDSKGPLSLTKRGKVVELAFEGQAKDGSQIRVTAHCAQIDEF